MEISLVHDSSAAFIDKLFPNFSVAHFSFDNRPV